MNKIYDEALEILSQNVRINGSIANLNLVIKTLQHAKKQDELLGLYQKFFKELSFEIVVENNSNDYGNWEEEYLDQSGATDESIVLFKKIEKIETQLKESEEE